MKITQDVRDYAATLNDPVLRATSPDAAKAEEGMAAMSKKFNEMGGEVYVDAAMVKDSNKAL
jgi:phosphomethylpyrimidine synthase